MIVNLGFFVPHQVDVSTCALSMRPMFFWSRGDHLATCSIWSTVYTRGGPCCVSGSYVNKLHPASLVTKGRSRFIVTLVSVIQQEKQLRPTGQQRFTFCSEGPPDSTPSNRKYSSLRLAGSQDTVLFQFRGWYGRPRKSLTVKLIKVIMP